MQKFISLLVLYYKLYYKIRK